MWSSAQRNRLLIWMTFCGLLFAFPFAYLCSGQTAPPPTTMPAPHQNLNDAKKTYRLTIDAYECCNQCQNNSRRQQIDGGI